MRMKKNFGKRKRKGRSSGCSAVAVQLGACLDRRGKEWREPKEARKGREGRKRGGKIDACGKVRYGNNVDFSRVEIG